MIWNFKKMVIFFKVCLNKLNNKPVKNVDWNPIIRQICFVNPKVPAKKGGSGTTHTTTVPVVLFVKNVPTSRISKPVLRSRSRHFQSATRLQLLVNDKDSSQLMNFGWD